MKNEKKAQALEKSTRALVERGRALQQSLQEVVNAHGQHRQRVNELEQEFHRLQGEDRMLTKLAEDLGVNLRALLGLPPPVAPAPAGGPGDGAEALPPGGDEAGDVPSNVTPIHEQPVE